MSARHHSCWIVAAESCQLFTGVPLPRLLPGQSDDEFDLRVLWEFE